jgi:GntR family transcriptional regulator
VDAEDERKKTDRLADTLRELIESGEWEPGRPVPSQNDLATQFRVSTQTARNAVERLTGEGLIRKKQGTLSQVHDREPTHQLVMRLSGTPVRPALERVAETPISFAQGPKPGRVSRQPAAGEVPASRQVAALLGLPAGEPVLRRSIKLVVGKEPVLTSDSYLPAGLVRQEAGDDSWTGVGIGQLALPGQAVTSVALEDRIRMPTPAELSELGMFRGNPVRVLSHAMLATTEDGRSIRAAVVVVARGDRVFLRFALDGG